MLHVDVYHCGNFQIGIWQLETQCIFSMLYQVLNHTVYEKVPLSLKSCPNPKTRYNLFLTETKNSLLDWKLVRYEGLKLKIKKSEFWKKCSLFFSEFCIKSKQFWPTKIEIRRKGWSERSGTTSIRKKRIFSMGINHLPKNDKFWLLKTDIFWELESTKWDLLICTDTTIDNLLRNGSILCVNMEVWQIEL